MDQEKIFTITTDEEPIREITGTKEDIAEQIALDSITKYLRPLGLTLDDINWNAILWVYYSFCNQYTSLLEGPFGQLMFE